jgi:tetratricopeptide (TPR) repeat protein
MKKYGYLTLALLIAMLVLTACSSNKKVEEPVVIPPTPLELARAYADSGATAYTDEDYFTALNHFTKSRDYYVQAAPTAAPTDSVDVNVERIQLNIVLTYTSMAVESEQLNMYGDALNEYESAANIYKSLVPLTITAAERDSRVSQIYTNMALIAEKAGQYERALGYYDNVLVYEPDNQSVLYSKYTILKNDINDPTRAFQVLADYAEVSQNYTAYQILAQAYRESGDNNTAAVYYDRAMELGKNAAIYRDVADFYRGIKNYAKANEVLEKLVAANPDNPSLALAYRVMADNYDKLKNVSKKIEYYDKSLGVEDNADVALILSNHWNQQKNWDRVITYATKVINIDSSKAAAYLLRGNAYYMKKNNAAAKADLQRIQNDPNYGTSAQAILKKIK